jgi:hypothetical protein
MDKLRPLGRGGQYDAKSSHDKAALALPAPIHTTGLTEVEALTFKNDHQAGAGNGLTLNERV